MEYLIFFAGVAVGIVYAEVFLRRREMPYVWTCGICASTSFSGNDEALIDEMGEDHMYHFHQEES